MAHCHEMKAGQIFVCEDCGLELTVTKECTECSEEGEECCSGDCIFSCCGSDLVLKG
jgi:hypothetical protein